ncbi:hypothetical protein [Xanthomonas theicola]|uniref:hypothetical protein n=1 Tax=Xanthomonas theicola TaxID=56464 RepID=UPI0026BDA737
MRRLDSARDAFSVHVGQRATHVALFACLLILGGCNLYPDPALVIDGGCAPASSPFLVQEAKIKGRITFCQGGDAWTGKIESQRYPPGTQHIEVMLSGYPGSAGVIISAVTSTGKIAPLTVPTQPGEHWQRAMLAVPRDIAQDGYRLRIDDQSRNPFGWAGLGDSRGGPAIALTSGLLPMLVAMLLGNCWLIAVSLCLPAGQPARDRLLQGVLAGGCGWFLIFLNYVLSTKLGRGMGLLLLILPFPLALMIGRRRRTWLSEVADLQYALLPVLMLVCLVLWIGLFPFHWNGQPNGDPALRWRGLTIDAWLPMLFGDMLAHGRLDIPMIGDWLSSDRPPLQVGLYLMLYPLLPKTHALVYQGISSWAQALVLLPVASLLSRFMDKRAQAIALFVLSISALMLFNTLFVWPKLLAGAFSLIYYIALFPADGLPRRWWQAGVAAAMALLAHGGALFFIVGVALLHLCWYQRQSLAMLLRTGPVAAALYLPWIAYQRFIDPPGDRLIKWHFAGKIAVSDESATHAIVSAYSQLTPELWLSTRLQNFAVIVQGALSVPYDAWKVIAQQDPLFLSRFIDDDFVYLFHSMWFASPILLLPCMVVMYWRGRHRSDPAFKHLLQALMSVVATTLVWVTLIFEGGATTIHIGAYASVLLLQLAVLAAAWRTNQVLFHAICMANISVTLSAYVFDRQFLPGVQSVYVLVSVLLCGGLAAATLTASGCLGRRRTDATVGTSAS